MDDSAEMRLLREHMVKTQIENRGITNPLVLEAMRNVPRQLFVPKSERSHSYDDSPLPIGYEQTISQPYIVAYMTELLWLKGGERVLEIGTGCGYQTAVLSRIVRSVYSIEIVKPLYESAKSNLEKAGCSNVYLRNGDGYSGWPEQAPFDAIILTASPPALPEPLLDQLKTRGRMVLPEGRVNQSLVVVEKTAGGTVRHLDIPVRFVPMTGIADEK